MTLARRSVLKFNPKMGRPVKVTIVKRLLMQHARHMREVEDNAQDMQKGMKGTPNHILEIQDNADMQGSMKRTPNPIIETQSNTDMQDAMKSTPNPILEIQDHTDMQEIMEGTSDPILGIQDDEGIEWPPPRSLETKDNVHRVMEGTEEGIVYIQAGTLTHEIEMQAPGPLP